MVAGERALPRSLWTTGQGAGDPAENCEGQREAHAPGAVGGGGKQFNVREGQNQGSFVRGLAKDKSAALVYLVNEKCMFVGCVTYDVLSACTQC